MKYYEVDFRLDGPKGVLSDACDVLAAMTGEVGFETFEETELGMKGYIQTAFFDEKALKEVLADFPFDDVAITYSVQEAEYKDWNETWENEGFEPITVDGRIVVHDGRHMSESLPATALSIEIDAKLAFGTGTHETTRMMLSALLAHDMNGKSVLDCGCGTGILAIAALKLGSSKAFGYDIDEWSTDNTRHNAVINRVDERLTLLLGDVHILNKVKTTFDVILANINRNILLADMPAFRKKMSPDGRLILSGFYTKDAPLLIDKAMELGLAVRSRQERGDWCCLTLGFNS